MEVSISKALNDLYINHDEFILVNMLKEYDEMKNGLKNLQTSSVN